MVPGIQNGWLWKNRTCLTYIYSTIRDICDKCQRSKIHWFPNSVKIILSAHFSCYLYIFGIILCTVTYVIWILTPKAKIFGLKKNLPKNYVKLIFFVSISGAAKYNLYYLLTFLEYKTCHTVATRTKTFSDCHWFYWYTIHTYKGHIGLIYYV